MIKTFSTQHLRNIFAEENKYEAARNLMLDLALGREIIHDGKVISKQEANDKVRQLSFQILEIQKEKPTKRDLHRAMERHGKDQKKQGNSQGMLECREGKMIVTVAMLALAKLLDLGLGGFLILGTKQSCDQIHCKACGNTDDQLAAEKL